jgi:hypothetical protein
MTYVDSCVGCQVSQGLQHTAGGIVKLSGNWIVNQYGGGEGFLGWLALQPRFHRMALSELTDAESRSLGPNIQALDACLTWYWCLQYPDDPVLRVYVVYFFESALQKPEPEPFHLHIHIIPRFRSLETEDRLLRTKNGVSWVDGWRVPLLACKDSVPEPYCRSSPEWEGRASALMTYLRHELSSRP